MSGQQRDACVNCGERCADTDLGWCHDSTGLYECQARGERGILANPGRPSPTLKAALKRRKRQGGGAR
jgi:hypothetical protein